MSNKAATGKDLFIPPVAVRANNSNKNFLKKEKNNYGTERETGFD